MSNIYKYYYNSLLVVVLLPLFVVLVELLLLLWLFADSMVIGVSRISGI